MNRMQALLYPGDPSEVRPRQTLRTGTPPVRTLDAPTDVLRWLGRGWEDLRRAPIALLHGVLVSVAGAAIVWTTWSQPWLSAALIFGFLLLGPALAVGVNDLARRLEMGERIGARTGLRAVSELGGSVWIFAGLLLFMFAIWASYAWLWMGVLNMGELGRSLVPAEILGTMLASPRGWLTLLGLLAGGALFALLVFAISLVTLPAMLDRRRGLVDAVATSLRAFDSNRAPLLLWGIVITALYLVSVATAFLALIVVFPWLGFAMWHGYRELVVQREATGDRGVSLPTQG
jgi:uncharacterized membrane protein